MAQGPGHRHWHGLAYGLLGVFAAVYLANGFGHLLFGVAGDLHMRWVEHAYFVRGVASGDVYEGAAAIDPAVGPAHAGFYPPWSLALGLLVVPPLPFTIVRWYFA